MIVGYTQYLDLERLYSCVFQYMYMKYYDNKELLRLLRHA